QQLVPFLPARGGRALRTVFASGDWVPLRLPERVGESFPEARVIGRGGATEATIWSNSFHVKALDPGWASIPYGRPIRDARYHGLDDSLEPWTVGGPRGPYNVGRGVAS